MRKPIVAGLLAVAAGVAVLLSGATPSEAQDKAKAPEKAVAAPKLLYGHTLSVRPGGEGDGKAQRMGVETFEEVATKTIVKISETGFIAVTEPTAVAADKKCQPKAGQDLRCRKADEVALTQKTKLWGVEMFHDRGINKLLYVCESGSVALAPVPPGLVTDKGPVRLHAMYLSVREPKQVSFKGAKAFGVEVFKDENTGGLIYITEAGAIATVASAVTPDPKKKPLGPKAVYGLDLRVRADGEVEITDKTKRISVEVFEDQDAKTLVYITETGSIAVVPMPAKIATDATGVKGKDGMGLRARKGDQEKFDDAKKYSVEMFLDNRTENLIFLSETGSIAVLPKP